MRGCDAFDFGAVYAIDFGAQRVAFGFDFAHRSAAIGGFAAQARDFAFIPTALTVKVRRFSFAGFTCRWIHVLP
jgi:hypothetical protein